MADTATSIEVALGLPSAAKPRTEEDARTRAITSAAPDAALHAPPAHDVRSRLGITLLIPALNEEAGLAATIDEAHRILAEAGIHAEVLVVDDGSDDRTAEVAQQRGARVVSHLYGRGYGYALRSGILAARHDTIVICDADGTYPLDRLPDLLTTYAQGYDLVIGARTGRHFRGSFFKGLARRFFHRLCESASGTRIADANSGFRVFRKSALLPYLPMMCTGFSFTTSQTLCFLLLSRPVTFVPVAYRERIGKTKIRILADALRTAQYISQMFVIFNPVKLFTLLAFVPAIGAVAILAGQVTAAMLGTPAPWWSVIGLASLSAGLSVFLFATGFVIYGVSRQRWPDPVSGRART